MKKKILVFLALLMSSLSAYSADWQPVLSEGVELFVDVDSIKYVNSEECYYTVRYGNEKVAYIKSNYKTNYIGVIRVEDYDENLYNPSYVFTNHVFMKPLKAESFLNATDNFVGLILAQNGAEKPLLRGFVPVAYNCTVSNLKEYAALVASDLEKNWQPPKSGRNSQSIIILTIGTDGSLQNYKMVQSSGDKMTDRSVISAVEKTVPYLRLPDKRPAVDLQFVFDYKRFRKSVI